MICLVFGVNWFLVRLELNWAGLCVCSTWCSRFALDRVGLVLFHFVWVWLGSGRAGPFYFYFFRTVLVALHCADLVRFWFGSVWFRMRFSLRFGRRFE